MSNASPAPRQRTQNCVEHIVEILCQVFGEKSQHEIPILLQQLVFAPVATVSDRIGQVLRAVQFNGDAGVFAQEIDFHSAAAIERNGQADGQP